MKMSYPKLTLIATAFFLLGLNLGCDSKSGPSNEGETSEDASEMTDPVMEPVHSETTVYCLYDNLSIREEGHAKGKWLASMRLGEKVTFTGETAIDSANKNREYVKVRLSDGKEGWAPENLLLMEGSIAVTLEEISLFDRPDLLTKNSNSIPRMVIVGTYNEQGEWKEIKGIPHDKEWYTSGWTKAPQLSMAEENIAAALMMTRAMKEEDLEKKGELLRGIVNDFSNSVFVVDANEMIVELEGASNSLKEVVQDGIDAVEDM